ncbi:hypothetical protein C8Q76DRAFT_791441 [Earliella scabrosa]|nr:hypothetical protein C8Q76DRAFT_791441 [Earliella scabrosa]
MLRPQNSLPTRYTGTTLHGEELSLDDIVPHLHYHSESSKGKAPHIDTQDLEMDADVAWVSGRPNTEPGCSAQDARAMGRSSMTVPSTEDSPHIGKTDATLASVSVNPVSERDNIAPASQVEQLEVEDGSTASAPAPSRAMRMRAHLMYGSLLWTMFLSGWNDATTGPLIPRIQSVYDIGFAVVSLIFVFNFLGFALAATANVWLNDRYGFGKVIVLGAAAQIVGYVFEAPAPPFPLFVAGHFVNGFGIALQATSNSFVAALNDGVSTKLAVLHACYGA